MWVSPGGTLEAARIRHWLGGVRYLPTALAQAMLIRGPWANLHPQTVQVVQVKHGRKMVDEKQVKVRWAGYGPEHDSWVAEDGINEHAGAGADDGAGAGAAASQTVGGDEEFEVERILDHREKRRFEGSKRIHEKQFLVRWAGYVFPYSCDSHPVQHCTANPKPTRCSGKLGVLPDTAGPCFGTPPAVARQLPSLTHPRPRPLPPADTGRRRTRGCPSTISTLPERICHGAST